MSRWQEGARVTVGIPAYGRPDGLAATIAAMRGQTYTRLRILVSDNASNPSLEEVVRLAAEGDPRVEYHRHPRNVGMMENFHWLVQQSETPFFMWAADDDGWDSNWIEELVGLLDATPHASLACGRFCWVDSDEGSRHVDVVGLDGPPVRRMLSYFWRADARLPHSGGYGGFPLYGLFRTPLIRDEWRTAITLAGTARFRGRWNAPDSIFLYQLLEKTPIVTTTRTRFHYCATRPLPPRPPRDLREIRGAKLRAHGRDVAQAVAHHLDYLRVPQPFAARLAAAASLLPKVAVTVARHEWLTLRSFARSRSDVRRKDSPKPL